MIPIVKDQGPITQYRCNKHGEFRPVTLLVPKGILDFLKDMESLTTIPSAVKKYLEYIVIDRVRADIDADVFAPTIEEVSKRYGLENILSDC